jgi:hypothetical protein
MSTPLVVLAAILAILAFILIPLVFVNSDRQQNQGHHSQATRRKNSSKRKTKHK